MLKLFRHKNVVKIVLWGILILILPAFVLWGTGNLSGKKAKGPSYVGMIDGRKISFDDFAESLTGVKCQIIMNYYNQPGILDQIIGNNAMMGSLAWDRLIMEREAKKAAIKVSNQEVVSFIKSHPIFLRDGKFDDRIYDYVLRRVPIDPRSFEEIVRQTLIIKKLNDAVAKDVKISDEEVLESYRKENGKIRISYLLFAADSYIDKAAVDDAKMLEYYEKNRKEFILPAATNELEGAVAPFEDVKDNIKGYLVASGARSMATKAAEDEWKAIVESMEKDKSTFEDAARGRGLKPVETGFFGRGETIDAIGEAFPISEQALKLKPGQVSEPVETRKGAVIFRVSEVQKLDEDAFKKDKEGYSKKALDAKKMLLLEDWLRGLEAANRPVIDIREYEKYYR